MQTKTSVSENSNTLLITVYNILSGYKSLSFQVGPFVGAQVIDTFRSIRAPLVVALQRAHLTAFQTLMAIQRPHVLVTLSAIVANVRDNHVAI